MIERTINVWDPLVRLFHWGLVVSFAVAWLTAENWDGLHEWAGYAAAASIAFRLIWGVVGSKYARFSQFIRPPGAIAEYLRSSIRRIEPRYIGHNPAGGLMILGLTFVMAGLVLTGWMNTLDAFWGVEWIEEAHEILANVMLIMVIVHILGVIFASLRHKENLVWAMISGRKRAPSRSDIA